jgi:type II secretory pathway pseudopilin PulG
MQNRVTERGVTLVEVILGVAIVSSLLVGIGFSVNTYSETKATLLTRTKAAYLAEEGQEIVRALRDTNWNTIDALTINTTLYLDVTDTTIATTNTPEVIDGDYRRSFIVREVYRNGSDDIVASTTVGATVDDGSRLIEMSVAGPAGTTTMEAILANVRAI